MLPHDYRDRVYAGWLGKCAGVRLGVPVENWTAAQIQRNLGELDGFLPLAPGTLFQPDDDTSVPLILIRALETYGPDVTPAQIGETILNGIADGRSTFWWGGYGVSTEHTVYLNLLNGVAAPDAGAAALNGHWLAEQIGGQIFSDVWGLVAPGQPAIAADYAARASSVTHDGAGVDGGRFVAALVSQAFVERDPARLIGAGLAQIAADGDYARVVHAVRAWHAAQPGDWRACLARLDAEFGPARYGGPVHIIPNAGVVALALLYGAGDFGRAVCIAAMAGWDTDCNAGNVGAIMGVAVGLAGIGQHWRAPMSDLLVTAGLIGSRNVTTISACADLFSGLGAQLVGQDTPQLPRCHFDYPGATHGVQSEGERGNVVALRQIAGEGLTGRGALQITLRSLNKKGEARVFAPTYLHLDQLSANNYAASFSPTCYPGQTLRARIQVPSDAPPGLAAALFAWDDVSNTQHQSTLAELTPGVWQTLTFRVPPLQNALLTRAGVVFRTLGTAWSGRVLLDWLDWDGVPEWSCDFASAQAAGNTIAGWTVLRGFWRLDDGAYHASGVGINESYTGDPDWRDLRLNIDMVPLRGDEHRILLRVGGARRAYAVGFAAGGRVTISKNAAGYHEVAAAPFAWTHGQRYHMEVTASGAELRVTVDDTELLRWHDNDAPYFSGQIGLGNGAGCHTRFVRVAVRGFDDA